MALTTSAGCTPAICASSSSSDRAVQPVGPAHRSHQGIQDRSSHSVGHNKTLTSRERRGSAAVGGVDDDIAIEPVVGTPDISSVINDDVSRDLDHATLVVVNHISCGFVFRTIGRIDAADVNQALTIEIADPDVVIAVDGDAPGDISGAFGDVLLENFHVWRDQANHSGLCEVGVVEEVFSAGLKLLHDGFGLWRIGRDVGRCYPAWRECALRRIGLLSNPNVPR